MSQSRIFLMVFDIVNSRQFTFFQQSKRITTQHMSFNSTYQPAPLTDQIAAEDVEQRVHARGHLGAPREGQADVRVVLHAVRCQSSEMGKAYHQLKKYQARIKSVLEVQ